ncbi:RelA/SpoT domain-containing protein [Ruminococcus sp. XPD3002]|uniref:RelA/SpoT domain-containing protein n=1 Tax=Ruminococcus sp. XPD3002 TaxID=1452269 RepID=UPI00091A2813|nr:hypothetical protein SAMN04487832_1118 [Ruminococcus flavefaciens]
MNGFIDQPKWKKVEYSRSQIIKAGKTIRKDDISVDEKANAITIIDNWRAAHAYPLHVIYMHLRRMGESNKEIIVAERLKRLDSILSKLRRETNMSLWTMQDLGGCRFIVPTIEDVYKYAAKYEASKKRHILKEKYDYIENPKSSGYRSVHYVYEYHSDTTDTYNRNMLIEIQFRTHLQHLWATAVETMGLFTKNAIKSGQGDEDVKRFFVLASSLFAIKEKQNIVPNTINDIDEIVSEIESLNAKHNYLDFLSGIKVAVDYQKIKKKTSYYILILNYETHRLSIKPFLASEFESANELYNKLERHKNEAQMDAVLVRVSSFETLRSAYPNYFSDINEFVNIIKSYLQ